ncbi:MAG: YggS family pyridoxal phosphate-dependent enzyme [Deltaproteobacteria bacterium]|nr:YggS family pyridoxal phosphate-dependent enzyme [Deltaproteobacteria bacterium]
MTITERYQKIRTEIPEDVTIVLAAKTRSLEEVIEVIDAGATDIGENYIQEAEQIYRALGDKAEKVRWHMIGPVQKNKINKALEIFDVIQTIDSLRKADQVNKRAERMGRVVRVLLEVNVGREATKAGVDPLYGDITQLAEDISRLEHVMLCGLMTMGPLREDPEESRIFFKLTKKLFDEIKARGIPGINFDTLSMGMSNDFKVGIEEGATMVRLGTIVFGARG